MRKTTALKVVLLGIFFVGLAPLTGHCGKPKSYGDLGVPMKTVKGTVTDVGLVDSKFTVRFKNLKGEDEEISFLISEKTKFLKNKVYLHSFTNLMVGDQVIVEYHDDPEIVGTLIADNIEFIVR
jgi:hypothetical protein